MGDWQIQEDLGKSRSRERDVSSSEPFRAVRGLCFVVMLENVLVSGSPKRTSTEKAKASARDRNTSIPS
jgi:hypothetical protein